MTDATIACLMWRKLEYAPHQLVKKFIAARTYVYQSGNVLGVQTADRRIAKRVAVYRAARDRRKPRTNQLKQYCRNLEWRNRVPHPLSDNDEFAGRS